MITADPLLLFLAAMLIDMYAGDWVGRDNWPWHPSAILENRIGWVESKLNRPARGTRTLVVRGALTTVIGIGLAVAVGRLIHVLTVQVPLFWIIELTLILSLVDLRRPWRNAIALGDALERDGLAGGRVALPVLSPRDPIHADAYEVARLGVEALASRFISGLIGPALSYLFFGLGGLFAYQALILLSDLPADSQSFHAFSNWLAAVIEWPVSNIGALVLVLAAVSMKGTQPRYSLTTFLGYCGKVNRSKNGAAIAAMAGALGLALEGPRHYVSGVINRPWIGKGKARVVPEDILAAARLFFLGCCVVAASIAVLVIFV